MIMSSSIGPLRPAIRRVLLVALTSFLSGGSYVTVAHAQNPTPLARMQASGLDTLTVGRVTAYFAAPDRAHAERLAALSESAAAYFERELGARFPLHLAVLTSEDWFDPYPGAERYPYGMPWGWVEDLLMTVPASLEQGVLISGSDRDADLRRVQFVLLHELGHLANKRYLHPDSPRPYSSVHWLEELLATYFAYAFVRTHDPRWAEAGRAEWATIVEGYTPPVLSLDWPFMRELPPGEAARTYGWYQNLLNLRVAELYEKHGLDLLRRLRSELPWSRSGEWTTETVLPILERVAPGFQAWADGLSSGQRSQ